MMTKMMARTGKKMAVGAAKDFAKDKATNVAVRTISNTLGVPEKLTDRVLDAGIPAMLFGGAEDPTIADKLFHSSKDKDKRDRRRGNRKESEDHFFGVFGDVGRRMVHNIAKETDANEDAVGGVMGFALNMFEDVIAEEEPEEPGRLQRMFKKEEEEVERQRPGLAKTAMKMIL
ncbi:MAG: hypothetical protein P8177_00400 [Gemmatimonadota bacterium]